MTRTPHNIHTRTQHSISICNRNLLVRSHKASKMVGMGFACDWAFWGRGRARASKRGKHISTYYSYRIYRCNTNLGVCVCVFECGSENVCSASVFVYTYATSEHPIHAHTPTHTHDSIDPHANILGCAQSARGKCARLSS